MCLYRVSAMQAPEYLDFPWAKTGPFYNAFTQEIDHTVYLIT